MGRLEGGIGRTVISIVAVSHWLCAPMIAYLVARNYEMPLRRLLTN
jgi:hypothetical protein